MLYLFSPESFTLLSTLFFLLIHKISYSKLYTISISTNLKNNENCFVVENKQIYSLIKMYRIAFCTIPTLYSPYEQQSSRPI